MVQQSKVKYYWGCQFLEYGTADGFKTIWSDFNAVLASESEKRQNF
jgi:hypothetical protein